jgi:hypothetical protein
VDHDRSAAAAARGVEGQRRDATDRARFRRVCVDDVGPLFEYDSEEAEKGAEIVDDADAAAELGDLHHADAAGEMLEACLAWTYRSVDEQRVVAAGAEPAIDQDDVARGSADVQPRDDPENARGGRAGYGRPVTGVSRLVPIV